MTFREAELFLSSTPVDSSTSSYWADLGCGNGLFTAVLSARLSAGSTVYAVDKFSQSLLPSANKEVNITFHKADFINDALPFSGLQGILMANSLHYVQDKKALLQKLKNCLLPTGVFIIVEYDKAHSNRWVPYPVSFTELTALFHAAGYQNIEKTGERKSVYQSGKMYICLIQP